MDGGSKLSILGQAWGPQLTVTDRTESSGPDCALPLPGKIIMVTPRTPRLAMRIKCEVPNLQSLHSKF